MKKLGRLAITALALLLPTIGGEALANGDSKADIATTYPAYQRLLDDYLVVTSTAPFETRFDYIRLHDNIGRYERFANVRRELLSTSPSAMTPAQRRAWAINTYNFLVIEAVTHHLVSTQVNKYMMAQGWRGLMNTTVQQIRVEGHTLFQAPLVEIDGRVYSLDEFERAFVFEGWDLASTKPRPKSLDPRAHFALVCAAQGCPSLRPRAFVAESLDAQLDRAVRDALASPSHLQWNATVGQLSGSSIFEWYAADFGGPDQAFEFMRVHAPPEIGAVLASRETKRLDRIVPWSWKLNLVPPKPRSPAPDSSGTGRR